MIANKFFGNLVKFNGFNTKISCIAQILKKHKSRKVGDDADGLCDLDDLDGADWVGIYSCKMQYI